MSPACIQEIGEGDKAPPEWLGEIEPTFLSYEAVPLLKFPFFNEVSFHLLCHLPQHLQQTMVFCYMLWMHMLSYRLCA